MIYPVGPQQTLQIATDYIMWAFAFDDELCDEGPASEDPGLLIEASCRIQRMLESPEKEVDPTDRYGKALLDIRRRLLAECQETQAARFGALMRTYFMAEMWKSVSAQPSLSDYMPQRLMGGGGMTFPFFCHAVPRLDLDEGELADRRIVALTEMAAMFALWDNDIFSWPKEVFRQQNKKGHNLIEVIGREYCCSVEDALVVAVDLRERTQGLYLRLHECMLGQVSPPMREYLLGLNAYISGVLQWHRTTPRFRFINGVDGAACLRGGEPASSPRPLGGDAPPIASIAWWWHYDPAAKERWSGP
ncbi:terpene synthase family protein [Pseudomonas kairouanensis]|nr:terpene synthase [Pseudomonas kairouanensis]